MNEITIADQDRVEAERFLKSRRSIEALRTRVLISYQAARRADKDPRGWGPTGFSEHVLAPAYRIFDHRYRQLAGRVAERAAWCFAAIRAFDSWALTPLAERSGAAAIAQASQEACTRSAVATAPAFNAGAFVSRLAQIGVAVTLTPSDEIAVRGLLHDQVKREIARHKADLIAYLSSPPQVIA